MGPSRHNHRKFRFSGSRGFASPSAFPLPVCSLLRVPSYPQNLILLCVLSSSRPLCLTFAFLRSSPRPISIDNLIHHCIYSVNLSTLSSSRGLTGFCHGILVLEGGFTLRCFQRLSRPHFASLLCRWHDNSCTSGASIPVLSY